MDLTVVSLKGGTKVEMHLMALEWATPDPTGATPSAHRLREPVSHGPPISASRAENIAKCLPNCQSRMKHSPLRRPTEPSPLHLSRFDADFVVVVHLPLPSLWYITKIVRQVRRLYEVQNGTAEPSSLEFVSVDLTLEFSRNELSMHGNPGAASWPTKPCLLHIKSDGVGRFATMLAPKAIL